MSRTFNTIRGFGTEIPARYKEEFEQQVLFRNLVRVRVVCWTLLISLIPYGVADYCTLTSIGTTTAMTTAMTLLCARTFIVGFTIFFLVRIGSLTAPEEMGRQHRHADLLLIMVYMIYMGFTLGYMYSFRTEFSVYLLFILVGSAFITWTHAQSIVVLASAFLSLGISLPLFGASWDAYKYGLITLGIMTGICYVLAQLTRTNQIQEFINKKTIERQNAELAAEQAEADKARMEAVKASQAKSEFLASMSHEIRTPMNAVLGMTEITLESELTEAQRRNLNIAHDSALQLLAIINDILDFSKIEAGKMSVEQVDFDLHEVLHSTLLSFRPQAESKDLTLDLNMADTMQRHCSGDPVRLRQILANLLSNAIKFTGEGGVTVSVYSAAMETERQPPMVRLDVIDTGVGVPPDKRLIIFDRFSQADGSITRKHGGTGLGLAISRRLSRLMGGTLEYIPNPEGGSIFSLVVPLLPGTGPTDTEAGQPLDAHGKLHVLVADDNPVNLQVTGTQLELLGHSCITVESGMKALDMMTSHRFDIVLMDVEMPEMDGLTATRIIRQGGPKGDWPEAVRTIPIFALTAHVAEDIRSRAIEDGMDGFLPKPVRMETLRKALSAYAGIGKTDTHDVAILASYQAFDPEGAMCFLGLSPETYPQALTVALRQLNSSRTDLIEAHAEGRLTDIARLVHKTKSTVHIMGGTSTLRYAEAVEAAVASGDSEAALGECRTLLDSMESLSREVDKWLANNVEHQE